MKLHVVRSICFFVDRCMLGLSNPCKLLELAEWGLCSSPLYHPLALETRRGFLTSGLCSGKTLWLTANVSYNSTNHVVKREDLQKDRGKNRKIK